MMSDHVYGKSFLHVYEFNGFDQSKFYKGDGNIVTDVGGINVYRARHNNGKLIFKYHLLDKFEVTDGYIYQGVELSVPYNPLNLLDVRTFDENFLIKNSYGKKQQAGKSNR